jgi:pentatricopeptide repeat protein
MYAKCGNVEDARDVFDRMSQRDIVTWNAMIVGYVRNIRYEEAVEVFSMMKSGGVRPDSITISGVLPACAHLVALKWGKEIHCYLIRSGIESNLFVRNALLDMYAKCQSIEDARQVFEKMAVRDVVSWNAMISGCAQNGYYDEAWKLFGQMQLVGVKPNLTTWNLMIARFSQNRQHEESLKFLHQIQLAGMNPDVSTLTSILSACAHRGALQRGKGIHAYIYRRGFETDVIVYSALLDMYAKCGHIHSASWVFDTMSQKDLVSWNSMIAGYAQNGHGNEAIQLLVQMQQANMKPDLSTIVSVLPACAHLAAMQKGKEIHNYTIRNGFDLNIFIENALIDMYAKCGSLENARRVFDSMPDKDVVSWNTMIAGYGMYGNGEISLTFFHDMQQASIKPNHITFIAVLSACSHAGLVGEGLQYFESMSQDHTITPTIEHYACMVDLLGRAGHLDKAYEFVKLMPFKPTPGMWGTLLSSCKVHSNLQLAERVADKLFELETENAGYYVLLSNIYAEAGRWEDAASVRARMKDYGVMKKPGCSWIEIRDKVYSFVSEDGSHTQSEEINGMSDRFTVEIKEAEYVPDTDFVLHDV